MVTVLRAFGRLGWAGAGGRELGPATLLSMLASLQVGAGLD